VLFLSYIFVLSENSIFAEILLYFAIQVFEGVQSCEMTEKFGDILQFCSHLSKLMVTEIRRRASNQSTGKYNNPKQKHSYMYFEIQMFFES